MSTASQTRIFGVRLGLDPKFLVLALVAVAALLFWYNSRSDETAGGSSSSAAARNVQEPAAVAAAPGGLRKRGAGERRRSAREDRLTLRLQPVSPASGDIDPVLRLDLLDRLAKVRPASSMRNLFESGPAAALGGAAAIPVRHITPQPLAVLPASTPVVQTAIPQVNIPYKYYGFARPSVPGEANRGFFMERDDILLAAEGQLLQQRYRVIRLTPTTARLEDTQMKQEQTLTLVPQAMEQGVGGPAYGQQQEGQGFVRRGLGPGGMQPGVETGVNPGFPNQPSDENQP